SALLAHHLMRDPRPLLPALGLAAVIALQLSLGHPQMTVICLIVVGLYSLGLTVWNRPPVSQYPAPEPQPLALNTQLPRPIIRLTVLGGAVALGAALAAAQLGPTWELTRQSVRPGGLAPRFFPSFSLPPPLPLQLIYPFPQGDPFATRSPAAGAELAAYPGILTLGLALWALGAAPRRLTLGFGLLAALGVALAWG